MRGSARTGIEGADGLLECDIRLELVGILDVSPHSRNTNSQTRSGRDMAMITRRHFLVTMTSAAGVHALRPPAASGCEGLEPQFILFTKHFLGLDHERLADVLASLGVTCVEAPIRPKGHVEPERVADDLPRFAQVLKDRGVAISVISSSINAVVAEQHTEEVLRTARVLGISRYRMNWYYYDLKKPIWAQLDEIRPRLRDLVAFSKEVGVLPCYQNHSGRNYVGAPVWDMALLMRDYRPTELAWCFDLMHATIEGTLSWPIELNLARDHIEMVNFKNFVWQGKGIKDVPLADGVIDRGHVDALRSSGFRGPVTLHVEHLEHLPRDGAYLEKAIAATRKDMALLRSWWA
jgi:sugar phosphate isomerase/epimerase